MKTSDSSGMHGDRERHMNSRAELLLPPKDLIYRVAGTSDPEWFVKSGRQSVRDIQTALASVGRTLAGHHRVLDFGCGCGRIMLQLEGDVPLSSVTGVDIDAEAIEWLRPHVPESRVFATGELPPLPFDSETFDLVYCHSVFTHLDMHYQNRWLEELRRVTQPGAALVISFSGKKPFESLEQEWIKAGADPTALRNELESFGLLFISDDGWKNGPFPPFYHSTFHTVDYVKQHWGRYFRILNHIPCGSLNYQDFIVMERTSAPTISPSHQETPDAPPSKQIPMPPLDFRRLVGPTDDRSYDNPGGAFVFPEVPSHLYAAVFDFASGCGRQARQLMQQKTPPQRYVGIDIHRGMVEWCQANLSAVNPNFQFFHHDVYNPGLAPNNSRELAAPFPVGSGEFTLVNAHSVFTHIYDHQTAFYLGEISRILTPDGMARTTWFFFDRRGYPWLEQWQNSLFVNADDPTNAVIYDIQWFLKTVRAAGLAVSKTLYPSVPGHQWQVFLEKRGEGAIDKFPADDEAADWICGAVPRKRSSSISEIDWLKLENAERRRQLQELEGRVNTLHDEVVRLRN